MGKGTTEGGVISLLLSNILLDVLDKELFSRLGMPMILLSIAKAIRQMSEHLQI